MLSKLNPLQKLVYAGLKAIVIPLMVVTGLLYMFYRYPQRYEVVALNVSGLRWIAVVHTVWASVNRCGNLILLHGAWRAGPARHLWNLTGAVAPQGPPRPPVEWSWRFD